jgi:cytochrome c-type biogenesis protein CcmF
VRTVRRWTLVPWMFLSLGIIMGSQWAYMELGWGGYWAWDPVENASFLPWLTATAFLHSIIIQEQRGILKVWNVVLIWDLLPGHPGHLHHAQRRAGERAQLCPQRRRPLFPGLHDHHHLWLFVAALRPHAAAAQRADHRLLRQPRSRLFANNWLFAGIAFATLWGTFFPMFSEIITGQRISVAAPFFNKVNGPLFLALILLMGVGPLLGWRHTSLAAFRKQFTWPIITGLAVGLLVFFFARSFYPIIGLAICGFALATIVQEYVRGFRARRATTGENPVAAMANLWRRNGRRYGGYIVHLSWC